MLENTEGAIKIGQSIETGNIGYIRRRKPKQKHNRICVGHHFGRYYILKLHYNNIFESSRIQDYKKKCIIRKDMLNSHHYYRQYQQPQKKKKKTDLANLKPQNIQIQPPS